MQFIFYIAVAHNKNGDFMDLLYLLLLIVVIALQLVIIMGGKRFDCPRVLMHEGVFNTKNIRRCRVTVQDIIEAARLKGYFNLADIDTAVMEKNGQISFLPTAQKRPLSPKDFNFSPVSEGLSYVVYQNSKLDLKRLEKLGFTEEKLRDFLQSRGYSESDISLIIISESGRVSVFSSN